LAYQTDTNKNVITLSVLLLFDIQNFCQTLKKVVNSLLEARGISKDDDRFIPEYHKTYNKLKLRLVNGRAFFLRDSADWRIRGASMI